MSEDLTDMDTISVSESELGKLLLEAAGDYPPHNRKCVQANKPYGMKQTTRRGALVFTRLNRLLTVGA